MTSPSDISSHNVLYHADEVYDQLKLAAQAQPHRMNSPALVCLEAALLPARPTPADRLARARELRAALPHGKLRASVIDSLKRGGRA